MEIKLPENPNLYFIVLGGLIFLIILSMFSSLVKLIGLTYSTITLIILSLVSILLITKGYNVLKKTQDLKDKKIEEELHLLNEKIRGQSLSNEKIIGELTEKEDFPPSASQDIVKKIKRRQVEERIKK